MKRCSVLILLLLMCASMVEAEENAPSVDITFPAIALLGEDYIIKVTIYDSYIESSTLEIDTEFSTGWGETEQGYFDFIEPIHEIQQLLPEETLSLDIILHVHADAAIKDYDVPILFYGKYGECAEGCIPFRQAYIASFSLVDPTSAPNKEALGDTSFQDEHYSIAKTYYEQAYDLYDLLGNETKKLEISDKIDQSQTGLEALQLYESGKSKYNVGNKVGALADFIDAKTKYETIGNTAKVQELEDWIEMSTEPQNGSENGEDGSSSTIYVFVGIALVIVIIAVALITRYK